jgi:predicted metal-dependent HD superfamily phosphohydrolase
MLDLRDSFARDAQSIGATRNVDLVLKRIVRAYAEPHRAYHTLEHVRAGLEHLEGLRTSLMEPSQVNVAYWFHDVVYARGPLQDNEGASARAAREALAEMGVGQFVRERISSMILATKTHLLPAGVNWGLDPDLETLLDVDLAILGSDPQVYARFERDVRREYDWVPFEAAYTDGRAKVLRTFLARKAIFKRPELYLRWEERARENMTRTLLMCGEGWLTRDHVDGSERGLYVTRKGRLVREMPWRAVYDITLSPDPEGVGAALFVTFGTRDADGVHVPLADPAFLRARKWLRRLPGYEHAGEERGVRSRSAVVLYRGDPEREPVLSAEVHALPYR